MKKALLVLLVSLFIISSFAATTIKVLVWDDALTRAVQSKLKDFEKETGIKVIMELVPSGSVLQKIAVGVSSKNTQYDIVAVDEPYVPSLGDLLEPYDKWSNGNMYKKPDLNVIMKQVFDAAVWKDAIVGLPINGNIYVWMTRRDIIENKEYQKEFKEMYGYDLTVPQTFEQLLDIAKFLKKKGIYGFAPFTKTSEGATCEAMLFFSAYGTIPINLVNGKYVVSLDKERAIEAINMYKKLLEYAPVGANNYGHSERIAAFNQGKVFSMFQWPAIVPDHEDPNKSIVAGKIIYSAPPAGKYQRAAVRGAWVLGIPKASKNKEAAAEFAYWWSSYEAGKELVKVGMTPARVDLLKDSEFQSTHPWFEGIFDSMKYATSRPRIENYAEVSNVIKTNWIAAVTGTMSPEMAVNKMIEELLNVVK